MKEHSVQKNRALYHPKFWGYWVLLGFLWLLVQLPWTVRMALGGWIGRVVFYFARHRREVAQTNLHLAFADLDDRARNKMVRRFSESAGKGFIETGMGWFWSEKSLSRISRFEGDPDSIALIEDDSVPLVLIGSHSTLMELGLRLLGMYVDAAGMYRPLKNPFFERWIKYQRARAATEMVYFKDMRHVFRIMNRGANLWYALDQDMGYRVSVFAPFFGMPACSVNVLPKLHARTGARWVPVFIWRDDARRQYVVKVLPEVVPRAGERDEAVAARVNAIYEAEIRLHPEQYFWVHRRFKNRPEGEADVYPRR